MPQQAGKACPHSSRSRYHSKVVVCAADVLASGRGAAAAVAAAVMRSSGRHSLEADHQAAAEGAVRRLLVLPRQVAGALQAQLVLAGRECNLHLWGKKSARQAEPARSAAGRRGGAMPCCDCGSVQ